MSLKISELAKAGEVGVETVRFYQRKGLLDTPVGDAPAGRHYGSDDVRRLHFIRSAQEAGFTLREIAELIEAEKTDDRARARAMAAERIADLDAKIATMSRARDRLGKLANECAGTKNGPCPIFSAFE
jgi:MerR family mercuric resistance operon transcriptional regulator